MADVKSFAITKDKPRRRNRFDIAYNFIGTGDEGALIPFYMEEVVDGDTFDIKETHTIRYLQTPAKPTMQPAFLDTYFFYVPFRILWKHWDKFFGVAEASDYDVDTSYILPKFTGSQFVNCVKGSVANCLKIPVGYKGDIYNPLPFIAYLKIWADHFRDQQTMDTPDILELYYEAASGASFSIQNNQTLFNLFCSVAGADYPTSVCKYHDYFTGSMVDTQRGTMTSFSLAGFAPVIADSSVHEIGNIILKNSASSNQDALFTSSGIGTLQRGSSASNVPADTYLNVNRTNLVADMTNISQFSIEDLRVAIATQRYKENLLLFGSGNYHDLLRGMYGLAPHDETLQRSEILGGSHQMLNMQQVATTAGTGSVGTDSKTSTGSLGAYSVTSGGNRSVIKTFKEPGLVLGLCSVRVKHYYSQGLAKIYSKTSRFDYYNPLFDALGAQPIKEIEIYAGTDGTSNNIFAFQEAWAEYRHDPSWIAGDVTPGVSTDLTAWTYGDKYTQAPTRTAGWIKEDKGRLAQTLAGSTSIGQLLINYQVINTATRPISLFSQPSSLGM